MKFLRRSAPPEPDFVVYFADGEVMTWREGITWDDVPKGRAVTRFLVGGHELIGYERYAFAWEGDPKSALLGVGVVGETATVVRVPTKAKDGDPLRMEVPADSIPLGEAAYRP